MPKPPIENAGLELFELLQEAQGSAFVSDGNEDLSNEEVLQLAENALYWTRVTQNQLMGFIRRLSKQIDSE